jgi:uroporphyrinogen decarboxylase
MTSRERWLAVLKRDGLDRAPMDYWATSEATAQLMKYLDLTEWSDLHARLHTDPLVAVGPRYVGPSTPPGVDMFGCRYQPVDYDGGTYHECVEPALAGYDSIAQVEAEYTWPSLDWWDYSDLPRQLEGKEDLPIAAGHAEPFARYKALRGQAKAYEDLIDRPEFVHYCLEKLFVLDYVDALRIFETIPGQVLISYVNDDLGGQESLLMSPAHIHEFLVPHMKRLTDLIHQAGAFVFHHNDGAIRRMLPDLVAVGIDILNPVQWRCTGMEREALKRDFGANVIFHGGVDNQHTLARGTIEDVRQEVVDNLRLLGSGGGYILAPCHNIQTVTPPENIVAMYDTAYECGGYSDCEGSRLGCPFTRPPRSR